MEVVTVRQRIDQLAAEPPVSDLGYVADQRLVASALLGLQLLADEIDALKAGGVATYPLVPVAIPDEAHEADIATISDIVAQLRDLSEQVVKLTAAVKASAESPQLALLSHQVGYLAAAVMGTDDDDDDDDYGDEDEERKKKQKKKKKKRKEKAKRLMLE